MIRGLQRRRGRRPARVRARARGSRSGSSSTWTWAGPPSGTWSGWCRSARSSTSSRGATGRSRRCARTTGRPAERFRLAGRHHVRGHRLDHRAVLPRPATAAASPPTAPACSASTASAGSTCASCCATGATDDEIAGRIADDLDASRTDRGAEERAGLADRGVLHQIESLRADPRREMHTRGG